ncbi:MAG: hypothetical protein LBC19_09990 [Tannerella sp.]|nr:hypothetical protein [Tannerella sp.]
MKYNSYNSDSEGLTGTIDYRKACAAGFDLSYSGMEKNPVYNGSTRLFI